MAPVPNVDSMETHFDSIVMATIFSTISVISFLVLAIIGCGCCGGGDKEKEDEKKKMEGGSGCEAADEKGQTVRKPPEKLGIKGGNAMYRTMIDVDKEDFVASDKKDAGAYVDMDALSARKKATEKKKDFASGKDPAYKSLMGVDDKFEPSAKNK